MDIQKSIPKKTIRRALSAMGLLPVVQAPEAALAYRRSLTHAARLWLVSTVILQLDREGGVSVVPYGEAYEGRRLNHHCLHFTTLTNGRGQVWAYLRPLRRNLTQEKLMTRLVQLAADKFSDRPALIVHHIADGSVAIAASEYPRFETLYVHEPLGLPCERERAATDLIAPWSPRAS